jgi:hypothetical protein
VGEAGAEEMPQGQESSPPQQQVSGRQTGAAGNPPGHIDSTWPVGAIRRRRTVKSRMITPIGLLLSRGAKFFHITIRRGDL